MAERRMFAKTIVTSDSFLDMPPTARCLYFTLGMFADDDGFVNNPKSIMRQIGSTSDDINILIAKKFLIAFESGVIVIKHWKIHNYIQSDRYHPTKYQDEKSTLLLDENKAYTQADVPCIQDVSKVDTEVRLGKDSLGKDRLDTYSYDDQPKKSKRFTPPTVEEVAAYIREQGYQLDAEAFVDYYEANGWMVGKNKMKDYKATLRNWERRRKNNAGDSQSKGGRPSASQQGSRRELFARLYEEHKDDL